MSAPQDTSSFARLVSLACHDLRTPLATAHGFAKTLERTVELEAPADRYVEMITAASEQLAEILDALALVSRIEAGRWEPTLREVDTLALAQAAAARVTAGEVEVTGTGGELAVDEHAATVALGDLARCAIRHGGQPKVRLAVDGAIVALSPVTPAAAPVVTGEDLKDLGAAVAVRVVRALGGSAELDGETLRIALRA